ncbi:hypothetical protein D7Y21_33250 [Corallococcus sp. AB045]|uniref:hypothetical protein n=1 Tax=Corallococcus sp. AB045 TaxID=2316719 RepID=UPI000EE6EA7E|nr:hypothetical protein [Corallococcus sp. AB045]RKH79806.1 hypothetical protein D7Y21_33250 [Corallococcus sp. AB045]
MDEAVVELHGAERFGVAQDSRVAASRWDVLPWGLVLDLDSPLSEAPDTELRRVWLCFHGLGAVTWPFQEARVRTGCWIVVEFPMGTTSAGLLSYSFSTVLPVGATGELVLRDVDEDVVEIQARRFSVLASRASVPPDAEGQLDWETRMRLASDASFVDAMRRSTR